MIKKYSAASIVLLAFISLAFSAGYIQPTQSFVRAENSPFQQPLANPLSVYATYQTEYAQAVENFREQTHWWRGKAAEIVVEESASARQIIIELTLLAIIQQSGQPVATFRINQDGQISYQRGSQAEYLNPQCQILDISTQEASISCEPGQTTRLQLFNLTQITYQIDEELQDIE